MKTVFISQPMNGKTNEEIRTEREELIKILEKKGLTVIDSIIANSPEEACNEPVFYLAKSIDLLSKVDYVYFMQGWEEARGCKIEHQIAEAYNIPIMLLEESDF